MFGPTQRAARLESSKVFAKEFMQRCNVPTARYRSCDAAAQAIAVLRSGEFAFPVVLKADGLAAGKGVVIAANLEEAESHVQSMMIDKRFGQAGTRVVIEDLLIGTGSVVLRAERRHPLDTTRFCRGSQTRA